MFKGSAVQHPQKWRETCDPYSLNYHIFKLEEVLGYPHAGNDVFYVKGLYNQKEVTAYIKVARQKGAAIENDVRIAGQLDWESVPKVIDWDFGETPFSVTLERPGKRLSVIVGDNADKASLAYMKKYGEALGQIHSITDISASPVADRRFFHAPSGEELESLGLKSLASFFKNRPENPVTVFCHGDFHYANVLWNEGQISGILDFELAGFGNRDFDIAWATALRPEQKFLKTDEELQQFLDGYSKYGNYDYSAIKYYTAQIYVHFLQFSKDNSEYCSYVYKWLKNICE